MAMGGRQRREKDVLMTILPCKPMLNSDSVAIMDNVDKFGERLREKRTAKGWTQLELAKRMDIAPMDVSNYERGAKKPRNERALLLAQVLGVSSAWLVFGVGEP